MVPFDPKPAREALSELPDLVAHESLEPPVLARVYVPFQHAKALQIDSSIVVGMRGAGKSWWTAVLASDVHREFVSAQLQGSSLGRVTARVGFALDDSEEHFPRAETLRRFLADGLEPLEVWRTVVLYHAVSSLNWDHPLLGASWRERVRWVVDNPDQANSQLTASDSELTAHERVLLILFDAFDRLDTDWDTVRKLSTAALRVGLQLRSRRSIRAKFFIRPDLEEDPEVWSFPDSSKLRQTKVILNWSPTDLYGLIFMHLGNAVGPFAATFRSATARAGDCEWTQREGVHLPPKPLTGDREVQQCVVERLADEYMGRGPKRGRTYTWVPLHLADAAGRISPRSYLLAFKTAADHTAADRPEHPRALHYDAIQQGVVRASQVRVDEIAEDYPWVKPLLDASRGAVVPMTADELSRPWSSDLLNRMKRASQEKLPPRRFDSDPFRRGRPESLIDDLEELAVLYRTKDGRLNMPDIFRVGFGIRRKGGVRPPR